MKATRNILVGIIIGAIIGWSLGFLQIPYVENKFSWLVGFISCLAIVGLKFIFLFVRNKNFLLLKSLSKNSSEEISGKAVRKFYFTWNLVAILIISGGLLISFQIYRQNEFFKTKMHEQNEKIRKESELMESTRRSKMRILLNDILDKVDEDLKNNQDGKLSDKTISIVVEAFNFTFIPYRYFEGDSLSPKKLSPEKGQLLLALFRRNIDSVSFNKIKLASDFSGADLNKGDLHGVDLSYINLKDADLSGADLSGADFQGADLRNSNLWGVHSNNSSFISADLRRANLSWAELNETQMESANFNGADLSNAQLMKSDLYKATFRTAKLDGALLNNANMESVTLIDVSLKKTNLTNVNLSNADINRANFSEAIMTEIDLSKILNVDKNWFEKLKDWNVTGVNEIEKKYKIVVDKVIDEVPRYRLEKK